MSTKRNLVGFVDCRCDAGVVLPRVVDFTIQAESCGPTSHDLCNAVEVDIGSLRSLTTLVNSLERDSEDGDVCRRGGLSLSTPRNLAALLSYSLGDALGPAIADFVPGQYQHTSLQ